MHWQGWGNPWQKRSGVGFRLLKKRKKHSFRLSRSMNRFTFGPSKEPDNDCCGEPEEQKQYLVEKSKLYMEGPCKAEEEKKPSGESKTEDSELSIENEGLSEKAEEALQKIGDNNLMIANKMMKQAIEKEREACHALRAGEFHKTVELFTDIIRFNPQLAVLYVTAIRDCDKAIKINPGSPESYHCQGKAFQLLGHWQKAARDLEPVTKKN
uniref:Hsp70-interacting protein N-terminal domain-containing protein n=1 Tax=Bubo bubo TaxID=30461 RepID=A0A8C0ERB5_BUBBB